MFFFTHDELLRFAGNPPSQEDVHWRAKASNRRTALDFQNQMDFDEICVGAPKPIDRRQQVAPEDNGIVGRPVSRGIVEGIARVAFSVEDAAGLQPGEILVAPITDVGWTPYFSMIAGLVTDVGSAVSHGAVIAREYGLPAIVNTRTATRIINTGDRIRLDADTGTVTLL